MQTQYTIEACSDVLNECTHSAEYNSLWAAQENVKRLIEASKGKAKELELNVSFEQVFDKSQDKPVVGQPIMEWLFDTGLGSVTVRIREQYVLDSQEDEQEIVEKVKAAAKEMGARVNRYLGPDGIMAFGFELPDGVSCQEIVEKLGMGTCGEEYPIGYNPTPFEAPLE